MPDHKMPKSVQEAEQMMKEDKIRNFGVDAETGKLNSVRTWDDNWILFEESKAQGSTDE